MAGTAVISTIKHDVSGAATTFKDGAGNEIGRFCKSFFSFYYSSGIVTTGSFNVSSSTRSSTGTYSASATVAFSSSGYAQVYGSMGYTTGYAVFGTNNTSPSTTSYAWTTWNGLSSFADPTAVVSVAILL